MATKKVKNDFAFLRPFYWLMDALFPRFCLSCSREGQIFCSACLDEWIDRPESAKCPFCEASGSVRTCKTCKMSYALDGLMVYLPYGNPVLRKLIGAWKYDGDQTVEPVLQKMLRQTGSRMLPPLETFVVAPVSAHITRKRARGFDQAEVISGWVAELFQVPYGNLLVRTRKTAPQAKKQHDLRVIGSLEGIFSLHPDVQNIPQRVLLCDDVFTSGATMESAAKTLKAAGVKEVFGFVIGKG